MVQGCHGDGRRHVDRRPRWLRTIASFNPKQVIRIFAQVSFAPAAASTQARFRGLMTDRYGYESVR
jgi:hypothetical protein